MYFLGLGIVLLLMKYFALAPVANWSWWAVLAPFVLAVLWWLWADSTGYTRRKAMEADDRRREKRIERQRDALGLNPKRRR